MISEGEPNSSKTVILGWYGGLNENGTSHAHIFDCLAPVRGTVWEGLGSVVREAVVLLERVCHWGKGALRFPKPTRGPISLSLSDSCLHIRT